MDYKHLCRGKRVDNGEWLCGFNCGAEYIITHYSDNGGCDGAVELLCHSYKVNSKTLGRCTGLIAAKSIRGDSELDRLVFEGDKLKCSRGNITVNGVVYWNTEQCAFFFEEPNGECSPIGGWARYYHLEIIGTIYDKAGAV